MMAKSTDSGWDVQACEKLIEQLATVRSAMLDLESSASESIARVDPVYADSARNFVHYLALRRFDMRSLQERLARKGISSLGRAESHVLANLDKVLGILHRLAGRSWISHSDDEPIGLKDSKLLLDRHTADLLGTTPHHRDVRIMVTMPSDASDDYGLVKHLVQAGMDVARINCAHDGPEEWRAMAASVRRAAKSINRPVRVLMDLGGPKLRTAETALGTAVLKLRPLRDELGRVVEPARLWLRSDHGQASTNDGEPTLNVDAEWLSHVRTGDEIRFKDARGSKRKLAVVEHRLHAALVECSRTAYIVPETHFVRPRHDGGKRGCVPGDIPRRSTELHVNRGDTIRLMHEGAATNEPAAHRHGQKFTFEIGCTLPEVFSQVRKGERVWFDDGRIGGSISSAGDEWVEVEITDAREGGEKLAGDKGINLPDSQLDLPALTPKDVEDLAVVAEIADMVGLSFVQKGSDVVDLLSRIEHLGVKHLGVVLKIETRSGFDHLPELLLAAMASPAAGVMIARGDLAVECGYERLAEVQEELLWACEAAHMPVIWATQVLETLAKTGRPSRAEVTDAAMGERSECVMLNKGPYILDAMRTLDDILKRMQAHQSKKRPLLRALQAWNAPIV